jgi:tetratricopeptide (TPR) repeat protein
LNRFRGWLVRRLGVLVFAVLPLAAAENNLAAQGWDHFYNLEYDQAVQTFSRLVETAPEVPAHYNYLAQAILYRELYRLGALESELLTGNDHFTRSEKLRPDPAVTRRFLAAIDKAIELASAQQRDEEALYALGSAYALRTNYRFLVQKSWRAAVGDGSQARKHHNRVLELNPRHYDALLTPGAYDYIMGSLPWHARLFSYLIGHRGDKQRGIRTIELVAQKGDRNRVDAQVLLAVIYRREKQPAKAIAVLDPLIRGYPRNYLFRLEKGHMLSDLGKKDEALAVFREVERLGLGPREKVYYEIGNVQFWYGDLEEALENMRRVTRSERLDHHTGVLAWMRTGQILDLTERRQEALDAYRRAIRFAPQTAAAEESKRYLSSPYRRKG